MADGSTDLPTPISKAGEENTPATADDSGRNV